jgi:hypothetical protein
MGAWANANEILTRQFHVNIMLINCDAERTMLRGEKERNRGGNDRKNGNHVGFKKVDVRSECVEGGETT